MRKRATFLSACVLAAASLAASDATPMAVNTTLEHELIAHERAIAKAAASGDEPAFAKLVAADAITVGPRGVTTAAEEEKRLPDAAATPWTITDAHVKSLDDRAVIVYYRGTEQGPSGTESSAWHSTVWVMRNGVWVAQYHQQTPITGTAVTSASTSAAAARTISPMELRDRVRLAKDIAGELVNGSRPLSDFAASGSSTLITVDRWPFEQLVDTLRDLERALPAKGAPKPGGLRAHVERANAIAAALLLGRPGRESVTVDRAAVERLDVELDALSQLIPLT